MTQVDGGRYEGNGVGRLATLSASTPSTVAGMLFDLDAHPGLWVLEIDTGTGDWALRLVVDAHGRCASGPFTMATAFPKRRRQRPDRHHYGAASRPSDRAGVAVASTTALGRHDVVSGPFDPVGFVAGCSYPTASRSAGVGVGGHHVGGVFVPRR
ncbi:hypothetical protein [Embleya sp. NPDC005971]|uniref:hypothetical protein n=1 Tax=Embleya sp. NPDC005971 TaxID=3156724 RepID=UPI0033E33D42